MGIIQLKVIIAAGQILAVVNIMNITPMTVMGIIQLGVIIVAGQILAVVIIKKIIITPMTAEEIG